MPGSSRKEYPRAMLAQGAEQLLECISKKKRGWRDGRKNHQQWWMFDCGLLLLLRRQDLTDKSSSCRYCWWKKRKRLCCCLSVYQFIYKKSWENLQKKGWGTRLQSVEQKYSARDKCGWAVRLAVLWWFWLCGYLRVVQYCMIIFVVDVFILVCVKVECVVVRVMVIEMLWCEGV